MKWKTTFLAAPALALAALMAAPAAGIVSPAQAACGPGDHINGSSASWARQKFQEAGYGKVTDLKKGCDNYWHGIAMTSGGQQQRVVVSPDGNVMKEGGDGAAPQAHFEG
ncbi:MAG: hypothetical protein GC201_14305 [Alphaproteobacteria bacterium]|nr:hypothetical protein [Alphaproteobacteria bacterium]